MAMIGNRFSRNAGLAVVIVSLAAGCTTGGTTGGTGKGGSGAGIGTGTGGAAGGGAVDGGAVDGAGASSGNLTNLTFWCNGTVSTADGGESTNLPGLPPLTVCVPPGTDQAGAAAKCQPKCMNMLATYVGDINDASAPNPPVVAGEL